MSDLVEVTTYSGKMRHLARADLMREGNAGLIGRGVAICHRTRDGQLYDQAALDDARSATGPDGDQIAIPSLPTCKQCFEHGGARRDAAWRDWENVTVGWGRARRQENTLSLSEVVTLRRLRNGEKQVDIARAQGVSPNAISARVCQVRQRFGVDTNEELWAHPLVVEQLREGGGAS